MNIYFSGIGGIGISSLAQFCLSRGDIVSGSDLKENNITKILINKGVSVIFSQKLDNISREIDMFIYSEAVPINNPERVRARELKIKSYSYFEYLGIISRDFRTIAVAGTHGKTTTTGLISSGMIQSKLDPTVIVGTILDIFNNTNFRAGKSDILVVEACEYRENFRFLNPEIIIITGVDHDHIDAFPTEKDYLNAFYNFIKKTKTVIYLEDDKKIEKLLQKFNGNKVVAKIPRNIDLKLIGNFNKRNAALAYALTDILDLNKEEFTKGLQNFAGISRRQEFIGEKNGIIFYDDYAHHPVEIDELYKGFKEKFHGKKVGIVFEPHQHSRTKELFEGFCESFKKIDELGIMPIYAARDNAEDRKFTINKFINKNKDWKKILNKKGLEEFLQNFSKGDVVIFCGAGDVSKFGRDFLKG